MKRIFIGGTGRSGTSILHNAMYRHHETYAFPQESKFLVEDSGMFDLVDALTNNFTVTHAQGAVRRFDELMRFQLTEKNHNNLGLEFVLSDLFGEAHYYATLDQFIDKVSNGKFVEKEVAGRFSKALYPSEIVSRVNSIPKYFPDRENVLEICREFIEALFDKKAIEAGRSCWVEKTPSNLLKISFLKELYPDAIFIHIKRDPRSVIYSLLKQNWAPNNIVDAANFMRGTYEKWLKLKNELTPSTLENFHEVNLESLISNPDEILNALAKNCGLSPYHPNGLDLVKSSIKSYIGGDMSNVDSIDRKINAWKYKLTQEDTELLNQTYGDIINAMGYKLSGEKISQAKGYEITSKSWLEKFSGLIR